MTNQPTPTLDPSAAASAQSQAPPPPPPEAVTAEVPTSPVADRPASPRWFDRRGVRLASIVGIVVGVLLLGVGIFGFVSASKTNADSQASKDQVAALEQELASLQTQRDATLEEASNAMEKAEAIGLETTGVDLAMSAVDEAAGATIDAGNALVNCGSVNDAGFVGCNNSRLATFQAALSAQVNAVGELQTAIAELEEALR
jgi:hypothetical protein